ncbi:hypothetical protein GH714_026460 [Hevea brasiliensis]|uniref:Photolyase/cryptochrome alpha/beta domain-containing protein n=1 Tax=Hevea brasiliensis TaxID=3981 RepID=A0A6A6MHW6_HEVBR|nr:hypothetical protein GH714_026460 [Hevea brasiliensis]
MDCVAYIFHRSQSSPYGSPLLPALSLNRLRANVASVPRRKRCSCSFSAQAPLTTTNGRCSGGSVIIWFKQDLRVDDHPGLVEASKYPSLVPLYVFDHRILSSMKRNLKNPSACSLNLSLGLLEQVKATDIFAEEEVEYHLHKTVNLKDLPASYFDFKRLQLPITSPLLLPTLPGVAMELEWGSLPTLDELKNFMNENPLKLKESWTLIKGMSAETVLQKKLSKLRETDLNNLNFKQSQRKRLDKSVFVTQKQNFVGGGTKSILKALAAYLRYLEGAAQDDWQEYVWYWLMALKGQINVGGTYPIRIWRWNGYLIQYTIVGHEGPAVLLVHGFGAFLEHYRDNINVISQGGNRVWAITILGFGKSEKPNVVYTELLWAELLRDFIIEVVGEPVHLVGNSIGGYFASIVACCWPALVKSAVLINSAGDVIPGYGETNISDCTAGCSAPFALLEVEHENNNEGLLPNRALLDFRASCLAETERVDDWLINEMLRASFDPGVPVVLESIFSLNLSLALNYLLEGFKEKVLIIQGMRDPLSDSKSKVSLLKEHCCGVAIRELDAGHCPQDEKPEEVNPIICHWVLVAESESLAWSFS